MNTGGPAFPCDLTMYDEEVKVKYQGMTLRDYFAAKALPSYWSDPDVAGNLDTAAAWAYEMADAMLKAREK